MSQDCETRKPLNLQRGLTLLEIIVVVFIIGIIATVVAPSFVAEKGTKAREEAEDFVRKLQLTQEQSLYKINLMALHITRDQTGYDVWQYSGEAKPQSNVRGVNERFSATTDFSFSLESQVERNDDPEGAKYWTPLEDDIFALKEINKAVDFTVVEIKKPVREDYKDEEKLADQLILFENGIITTPFEVQFKQDNVVYVVKLDEYSQIELKKLETAF